MQAMFGWQEAEESPGLFEEISCLVLRLNLALKQTAQMDLSHPKADEEYRVTKGCRGVS